MNTSKLREEILKSIDKHSEIYIDISKRIHANPELGNEEYFASGELINLLQQADFSIEREVAGHRTAFTAVFDSGSEGPTVAFIAEYDALPGIGHACGHNIIGVTSAAAAIALSKIIKNTSGKIIVLGTPAEEGGRGGSGGSAGNVKARFVQAGLLRGVDVALMIHPSGKTRLTEETLALNHLYFDFYGKPSHAGSSPHLGLNALDGVVMMYNGISMLRQQLQDDIRIHGIITDGGKAANIIPEHASAHFYIRAKNRNEVESIEIRLRNIAEGAAIATGTSVKVTSQIGPRDFKRNQALDTLVLDELTAAGQMVDVTPQKGMVSTDAGDISHEVPTAHPFIKIGPDELILHTTELKEAANSDQGYEALLKGAEVLAFCALRILTEKSLLDGIKNEHYY